MPPYGRPFSKGSNKFRWKCYVKFQILYGTITCSPTWKNIVECYLLLISHLFAVQWTGSLLIDRYKTICITSTLLRLHLYIFIRYKILFSSHDRRDWRRNGDNNKLFGGGKFRKKIERIKREIWF